MLNVRTIEVGDREFTLRLTSKALLNFNLKHGVEGNTPTIAVLGAVSDMAARVDLLTNALQHPESKNSVKDGGQLLDLMADDPTWDRDRVNDLILELAEQAGLISSEERADLMDAVVENNKLTIETLRRLLVGKSPEQTEVPGPGTEAKAENPT